MKNIKTLSAVAIAFLAAGTQLNASLITITFPEVNGLQYDTGFPIPAVDVQTETFSIPFGESVVSATFSGTFGETSQFSGSSARAQLLLDNVVAVDTDNLNPDVYSNIVSFSVPVSNLADLNDGSVTLSYIQTSPYVVRLSGTTLEIMTAGAVPDAGSSLALLGSAFAMLGALGRKFRK